MCLFRSEEEEKDGVLPFGRAETADDAPADRRDPSLGLRQDRARRMRPALPPVPVPLPKHPRPRAEVPRPGMGFLPFDNISLQDG